MTPVIKLSAALLVGAAFLGWQPAQAQTCSTAAWTGNPVGNAAAGTTPAVRRYSGVCGLTATLPGGGHVIESTNHDNEGVSAPFRARFFVYPAVTGGTVTVFQAMDADAAGNAVVQVRYDPANQRFDFLNSASAVRSTTGTAPPNRWYRVTVEYQANQPITGSVRGNGGVNYPLGAAVINAGAAGVQAVRLGAIAGPGTGSVFVDEYEASRAAMDNATPYSIVIRGDATGDGACNASDITSTANEILFNLIGTGGGRQRAPGQPDCTEDGAVNAGDITCTAQRIIDALFGTPCN